MAKKADKKRPGGADIARNRKAYFEFEILDRYEAGLVLMGSEVKGLRERGASINDAYATLRSGEMWLIGLHIPEYWNAGSFGHDVGRERKLLLHRQEIEKMAVRISEKGLAIIPLRLYFKEGRAKIEIGVGRGKTLYDKRRTIAERDSKRDLDRIGKGRR